MALRLEQTDKSKTRLTGANWREGEGHPWLGQRGSPAIDNTEAGIDDEVKPAPKTTKKNAVADTIEAGEIL